MAVSTFSVRWRRRCSLANDTPYGLAGYVMTKDLSDGDARLRGFRLWHRRRQRHGAGNGGSALRRHRRSSGFGREGSDKRAWYEYMDQKFVSIGLDV